MAKTNLAQHEQLLKSLEESVKEIDTSYQQVIESHKKSRELKELEKETEEKMYDGLCDLSNLIFGLFQIANDLRESRLELEKDAQAS